MKMALSFVLCLLWLCNLCNGLLSEAPSMISTRVDTFGTPLEIETVQISEEPRMLILKNFVSEMERQSLMWTASNHPHNPTEYKKDSNRNRSLVSWMPHSNEISKTLASAAADILIPRGKPAVHEELQVVRYKPQGEFKLHHDEQARIFTVLYYLNGVAGTWFPLARSGSNHATEEDAMDRIRQQCLEPGQDGILVGSDGRSSCAEEATVPILAGDAVVFYNYLADDTQYSDWNAIHAGLPASEEKWIATHWFH